MSFTGISLSRQRPLTEKQRRFVYAYAVLGWGPSEAYRKTYCSLGSPESVSSQAFRLLRTPSIRHAISAIRNADSSAKEIFAQPEFAAILKIKRLHEIALDPASPPYVAIRALELVSECEREEASRRKEEAETSSHQRQQELMRKLETRKPIAASFDVDEGLEDFSKDLPSQHASGHSAASEMRDDPLRRSFGYPVRR